MGVDKVSLDMTPKAQAARQNQARGSPVNKTHPAKETVTGKAMGARGDVCKPHICLGATSQIYKELTQLNPK